MLPPELLAEVLNERTKVGRLNFTPTAGFIFNVLIVIAFRVASEPYCQDRPRFTDVSVCAVGSQAAPGHRLNADQGPLDVV